jgi:organic radical activating enzyme
MSDNLVLSRLLLIPIDRCNLKCRLCSESIPGNKPDRDMSVKEARNILQSFFEIVDRVRILHISGGGEPFLHPQLAELVEACMKYSNRFDEFILFTNSTIYPPEKLLEVLKKYRGKAVVRTSSYGLYPEKEAALHRAFDENDVNYKVIKYHGEEQDYGGWVDYGEYAPHGRSPEELAKVFASCATRRDLDGNWRTRNGEIHYCTRSQRGTQLGLVLKNKNDYVDVFDLSSTREEKREKLRDIMNTQFLTACDYCSGDYGTSDAAKRYPAAEQIKHKEPNYGQQITSLKANLYGNSAL